MTIGHDDDDDDDVIGVVITLFYNDYVMSVWYRSKFFRVGLAQLFFHVQVKNAY